MPSNLSMPESFDSLLVLIRERRQRAFQNINRELIDLYWEVGRYLNRQVKEVGWGKAVVKDLADYLSRNEAGLKGFSASNLWRMNQFYETWCEANEKLASVMREIYPTANEHFKETYVLDFLNLPVPHSERELRKSIVQNLKQFIIEFG